MRYILAVGLSMAALGACQVAVLTPATDGREGEPSSSSLFTPGALTVMTRSFSSDPGLERVWTAPTAAELPTRAAELLSTLDAQALAPRIRALADELQYARPHLLGLQEVLEVRRQSPGDAVFGGTSPAFARGVEPLALLLGELESRGLHYREVARVPGAEVELPLRTSEAPTYDDVRFAAVDVVLARADVEVDGVRGGQFLAHREETVPGLGRVARPRGWASLEARVQGGRVRFVHTHLEPAPGEDGLRVQLAQAAELIDLLRGERLPVVLVGDFNTPANLGLVGAPTYRELLLAGYVDVWTRRVGSVLSGLSARPRPNLVLVRGPVMATPPPLGPVLAYGVGEPLESSESSESSGLVARLRLPPSPGYTHAP
jgi:hypothetical protein